MKEKDKSEKEQTNKTKPKNLNNIHLTIGNLVQKQGLRKSDAL